MYTTPRAETFRAPGRAFRRHVGNASDAARETFWIVVLAALAGALAGVLHTVVGPAPLPERLLEAVVFGGVVVLVAAGWQSPELRTVTTLFVAAAVVAAFGLLAPPAVSLVVMATAFLVLWRRMVARQLMLASGFVSLGLAAWAVTGH